MQFFSGSVIILKLEAEKWPLKLQGMIWYGMTWYMILCDMIYYNIYDMI